MDFGPAFSMWANAVQLCVLLSQASEAHSKNFGENVMSNDKNII